MKKVLVTGANGQLGKCIQDLGDSYSELEFTFTASKELDITNKNLVSTFFSEGNYDYCINCAAYTAVDKAEIESEKAFLINAGAVKYLAESCKLYGVTLIHISTDFVFDGRKGSPYTEEDDPNPINVYGFSKLKGEQYIQEILKSFFIIRTSWVYSEYGNNFVKTMLRLTENRDEISVVNDQIGSPTYARGLAKFLCFLINNSKRNYGIYNYSDRGVISWYDFALEIFEKYDKNTKVTPISSSQYTTLAERPVYSKLNTAKIERQMGVNLNEWRSSLVKMKNNLCTN